MHRSLAIAITLFALSSSPARAGVDAPGQVVFDFLAEEDRTYESFETIEADAPFSPAETTEVFFSTDASSFGDDGVLMWAGFALEGDPLGPRYGMLFVDMDLGRAPPDDATAIPQDAVRAEYIEKRGDELLFEGRPVVGGVWIVDIVFNADDKGAVEGDFAFVFEDAGGRPGCRVLLRGMFLTEPSPAKLRQHYGAPAQGDGEDEYVSVGCSGDVYVADDGGGCGGENPDSGGCEGDSSDGGGCEGDTGGGSGCEGDTGSGCGDSGGSSGCGGSGGGCGGDVGGGACAGAAGAAVGPPRRSGGPLRSFVRMLPEIFGLLFITFMRRRNKR